MKMTTTTNKSQPGAVLILHTKDRQKSRMFTTHFLNTPVSSPWKLVIWVYETYIYRAYIDCIKKQRLSKLIQKCKRE